MSDGISDGYKAASERRARAQKEFGALTVAELRAELAVAEDALWKAKKALRAAEENYRSTDDRHALLQSELYRRMRR